MAQILVRYRWRYFDAARGRHFTTRWYCTEEEIRRGHPDATAVPGSEQHLRLADNPMASSTARFCVGQGAPSRVTPAGAAVPTLAMLPPMCGRYALYGPHSRYREHFAMQAWLDFGEKYNVAPSSAMPVIRQAPSGERVVDLLQWGLIPHWAKDPTIGHKLTIARAETISEKPSFRDAFKRRRCLVPADGFYEWQSVGRTKQPYFIRLRSGEPMAMAGLWESWRSPTGDVVRTFCIVTTAPNAAVSQIHDRMPVLIRPEDFAVWLDPAIDGATLRDLLAPCPAEDIEAWPVSHDVNRASADGPTLIRPQGAR